MKFILLFTIACIALTHCYSILQNVHPSYEQSHLGVSVMGLDIDCYSDPHAAGKPKVLIVGNIHGDEVTGFDLTAYMLQQTPFAELDVLYVPSMNPDGMYYDMRENAERIDLNRAFPDACNRTNSTLTTESEIMMRFVQQEHPLVVIVYHGGAAMVVWGPEQNCTSDTLSVSTSVSGFQKTLMNGMADAYAKSLGVVTIEGSVMYQVAGSLPGYAVPTYSQLALTIEVDAVKEPSEKREEWLVRKHVTALNDLLNEIATHTHPLEKVEALYPDESFADNGGFVLAYDL